MLVYLMVYQQTINVSLETSRLLLLIHQHLANSTLIAQFEKPRAVWSKSIDHPSKYSTLGFAVRTILLFQQYLVASFFDVNNNSLHQSVRVG